MERKGFTTISSHNRGFTLIEILITISIIAVLSTIGTVLFQLASTKARDGVRKSDLTNLATALEIYKEKKNQYIGTPQPDNTCLTSPVEFYSLIAPYINGDVPTDPKSEQKYLYIPENRCRSFRLFAKLEFFEVKEGVIYKNEAQFKSALYNYSKVSDDLIISSAPGDLIPTP